MQKQDQDYILSLFPPIEKIKDDGIRQKVILTWYKAWKRGNFSRIEDAHQFEPARERIAYTNVSHTNQVCRASERMGEMVAEVLNLQVKIDHLLAGALLHDVDKMVIFDAQTGGFTDTGRRFAHAAMGAAMALMEGLPEAVAHMIGAHSAHFSPISPNSLEALILRHADHVVAKAVYLSHGLEMEKVLRDSLSRIA
jgi:putative nucleotidyltransferase with HDIG domain